MAAESSVSEQLRALTQLQDLSLKLSGTLALAETLDAIIDAAMAICRADRAAVSYLDDSGALRILRHKGLSDEYVRQRELTSLDPVISGMMTRKTPSIIENVDDLRGVSPNHAAWKKEGIASIVTLPLVRKGEVFGVIGAGSSSVRRYTRAETDSMAILATQAGAAITSARLFEQLREANKAKDEFLATLSHELRTPLTPILGWTRLLRPFVGLDPLLGQGLDTIDRNAHQLSDLIKDLLDLTRVISHKIELERAPTDLVALLETGIAQMRPQAEARGISIVVNLSEEPIVGGVDPNRVQQIVANLLENAVKFTPEGGRIDVTLKCEKPDNLNVSTTAVIEVADTGMGIEREFLPVVFERFTQAHGGINRRFGGLGLGLAITRAMAEAHGGEVSVYSDGPGRGSRFTVRLPITEDVRHVARTSAGDKAETGRLGLRVLVIEDSLDTSDMLKLWLSTFGCDVLVAGEAMEGIRLAIEAHPDLIISDIGMPDMDGYELMRTLRRVPALNDVPSIALTGYAREGDRDLALAAGYTAHISKPAEMSRLLQLIHKLTTQH
ncbi:MAG TPA: ATP-binding protein [Blastocatellia bacterium]|nr:ATP-binding protein [Blastocatellia bacterium]